MENEQKLVVPSDFCFFVCACMECVRTALLNGFVWK